MSEVSLNEKKLYTHLNLSFNDLFYSLVHGHSHIIIGVRNTVLMNSIGTHFKDMKKSCLFNPTHLWAVKRAILRNVRALFKTSASVSPSNSFYLHGAKFFTYQHAPDS